MLEKLSMRMIMTILFITLTLITFVIQGYIVFSSWLAYADNTITQRIDSMHNEIHYSIKLLLDTTQNKNQLNGEFIEQHIIFSKLNHYLEDIVKENNAFTIIVDKDSESLIANSVNTPNLRILKDGSLRRVKIDEINHEAFLNAYKNYRDTGDRRFRIKYGQDRLCINVMEYHEEGLNWIILTGVLESLFTAGIYHNLRLTIVLTLLTIFVSIVIYLRFVNKFLRPIDGLVEATESFSRGNLLQRAEIVRDDEIGRLAKSFNKMADTILNHVNELEQKVKERTKALEIANEVLRENKEKLQLLLDSTAEGIYGMDLEGKCTFCNTSGIKLLGYNSQEELLNQIMHLKIHHSYKDGTSMALHECKIHKALSERKGVHVEDEVFWRADGSCFDVAYASYPQYKDGKLVGVVVTFIDNTETKKNQEHIWYLTYHDVLTGLYNRMFFEDKLRRIDTKDNLPLSVIYGDVNGLKLTNDIFGHAAGDELLKKVARVFKKFAGEKGIAARLGGDEYALLLPNTPGEEAEKIMNSISEEISKEKIVAIKGSMSMGYATKTQLDQNIIMIVEHAESKMYKQKMLNRRNVDSDMITTIMETLHHKNPEEKQHSLKASELCKNIGQAMHLSEAEVKKFKEAGFFHDIGKIVLSENILKKTDDLTEEEKKELMQHPIIGFRILNLFQDTLDLAEGVLSHHENWDGSGYPKGLREEEIPQLSRVIRVVEMYEDLMQDFSNPPIHKEEALQIIRKEAGVTLDPNIAEIFIKVMSEANA